MLSGHSPKAIHHLNQASHCLIIDIRNPEDFAASHAPGSLSIPYGPSFSSWAGAVIPLGMPLVLLLNQESELEGVLHSLRLIGYDRIEAYALANALPKEGWISFPMISATDLNKSHLYVVDVRTDPEWEAGHIQGAHHHELNTLPHAFPQIAKDTPIAVVCGKGNRASIAASLLKQKGFTNVSNVRGGMQAWNQARLPTEQSRT